jgi:AraC-like DNA-binding protein
MREITHFYTLTPEWQHQLIKETNGKLVNDKIIIIPDYLGVGHAYFTQITPGISTLYMDFKLHTPFKANRVTSSDDLYIFHFDLSDTTNLIRINKYDYKVGYHENRGLAIMDNQIESSFIPAVNHQILTVRLLVDKKLLEEFIRSHPSEEYSKRTIEISKKPVYYYDNIDSNSVLLIRSLKERSIFDVSFDSYLKGVSLKLLGNFLNRYENSTTVKNEITEIELEAVTKTQNYLLENLYNPFPSVNFLSEMAGMSPSKYKMLFKKHFHDSPNNFFIKEKMNLANKLLQSGDYNTLTEIIYELNYSKLSYFCSKYYAYFNRKPSQDFVKKISVVRR